ncbi:MAG: alkaline phosphatase family protein, partial [Pseudomonadota bacterium]
LPAPPDDYRYSDPATDDNPILDSESRAQLFLSALSERDGKSFPPDWWVAKAALKLLDVKQPDLGFILLAECDDLQHVLGSAAYPEDFTRKWVPLKGFEDVCTYNENAFKEGIIDGMKDVDAAFGTLWDGIKARPAYQDATVVVYSDHGQITHRNMDNVLQMLEKSIFDTDDGDQDTNFLRLLDEAGLLTEDEKNMVGFCPILATSIGVLHWYGTDLSERRAKARAAEEVMEDHYVFNEQTRRWETPWIVLNQLEMQEGIPGVCGKGELWHNIFGENNTHGTLHWPDLIILMKERWQLPSLGGMARNIGVELPERLAAWVAPVNALLGGHGSTDTQDIFMAFRGPNIARGKVLSDPYRLKNHRISDIAVTLESLLGLNIYSNTVGADRAADMKPATGIIANPIITTPILANPILPRFRR